MKVFLTGATGYIGKVVAEKLQFAGHEVLGLARSDKAEAKLRERGIEPHCGEVHDLQSLVEGEEWGSVMAGEITSNSRVTGAKARELLGWEPKGSSLLKEIEYGSYRN